MLESTFNLFCGDRFVKKWRNLTITLFNLLYYILSNLFVVVTAPIPIIVGAILILTSPILLNVFSPKSPLKKVFFYFAAYTVIPLLSYFLDTIPTWLMDTWWLKDIKATHISQDSLPVMRNVAQSELHTFGDRKLRETVQALQPFRLTPANEDSIKHILYVHGGGFIAANAKLLMPSITPVVREGYTIWCTNYPLSPWNKFPTAVTSVMACLQWMRRVHGIERVALIGDSAGGALVTSVAAFATNPHLFRELWGTPGVSPSLREKDKFPDICGVVSLYVYCFSSSRIYTYITQTHEFTLGHTHTKQVRCSRSRVLAKREQTEHGGTQCIGK